MAKRFAKIGKKIGAKKLSPKKPETARNAKALQTEQVETASAQFPPEAEKMIAKLIKEGRKHMAIIAKLTAAKPGEKKKQLYFDEVELSERWHMSVKHIRTLRYAGIGPKVTYFGRSVRYRLRDIVSFEKENTFTSRSDMEVRKRSKK